MASRVWIPRSHHAMSSHNVWILHSSLRTRRGARGAHDRGELKRARLAFFSSHRANNRSITAWFGAPLPPQRQWEFKPSFRYWHVGTLSWIPPSWLNFLNPSHRWEYKRRRKGNASHEEVFFNDQHLCNHTRLRVFTIQHWTARFKTKDGASFIQTTPSVAWAQPMGNKGLNSCWPTLYVT